MKIADECIPCLVKRIVFEANQSSDDINLKKKAVSAACGAMSEHYDPQRCSAWIATRVHRAVYDALSDDDPYKSLKQRSNEVAGSLLPLVESILDDSGDRVHEAMLCSIVGNMMDYGLEGSSDSPDALKESFVEWFDEGLGWDDYQQVKETLSCADHILLFTDNCGEIVFDVVLCRELKRHFPNLRISLVVKGVAILSDATRKDAVDVGMADVVDEILETDGYCVGVDVWSMSDSLRSDIESCDMIVCKGMANYEAFSEVFDEVGVLPMVFLLRTKCRTIAASMGVPYAANIIKAYG